MPPEELEVKPLNTGSVVRVLDAVHLLRPAYRLRRYLRSISLGHREDLAADGLPIPPRSIRLLVGDNPAKQDFLVGGKLAADFISELVADLGRGMDQMSAILDFGCGCGRIARHWADLSGPRINGCDVNSREVAWCRAQLPFMSCVRTELRPPPFAVRRRHV